MLIDLPGRWQLMQGTLEPYKWYVYHNHGEGRTHHAIGHVYRKGGVCGLCYEPMPDEICGFIQLLEWER